MHLLLLWGGCCRMSVLWFKKLLFILDQMECWLVNIYYLASAVPCLKYIFSPAWCLTPWTFSEIPNLLICHFQVLKQHTHIICYRRIFVLIFHNHVNSCSCSIIHFIPGNVLEANAFGDCTTTFWIPLGISKTTLFWDHLCLFSTTASPHSSFICRQIKAPTLLNFAFSYVLIYSPLSQFVFPIFP